MSLLHALIARDTTILSESSSSQSNLQNVMKTVLSKIPDGAGKLSYVVESKLIHYSKNSDNIVFMVVSDDLAGRRLPFSFLQELERVFYMRFDRSDIQHTREGGCSSFNGELNKLMNSYLERVENDPLSTARKELSGVKDIMVQNINSVLDRGERISLLVSKTDNLNNDSQTFRSRSTALRRKMWWQNIKVLCLIGAVFLLALYILIASFCGASLHCSK